MEQRMRVCTEAQGTLSLGYVVVAQSLLQPGGLVAANTRVQNVGNRGHTPLYQEQYVWRKTAQGTLFP